jgi:hypothetical protein
MLKMCIPQEAVHHKMQRDEVSQKIIVAVLGQDKSEGPSNIANSIRPGFHFFQKLHLLRTTKSRSHPIPQRCSSFNSNQVLQRMKKEGIEEKIIVAVVGVKLQQSGAVETKDDSWKQTCFTSLDSIVRKSVGQERLECKQEAECCVHSPKVVTFRS